jgi:hypothetical protein
MTIQEKIFCDLVTSLTLKRYDETQKTKRGTMTEVYSKKGQFNAGTLDDDEVKAIKTYAMSCESLFEN